MSKYIHTILIHVHEYVKLCTNEMHVYTHPLVMFEIPLPHDILHGNVSAGIGLNRRYTCIYKYHNFCDLIYLSKHHHDVLNIQV
jgi:hypothetical protein